MVKIGDKIKITKVRAESGMFTDGIDYHALSLLGKEGVVTHIDGLGQLHGTWGSLAVIPEIDTFDII